MRCESRHESLTSRFRLSHLPHRVCIDHAPQHCESTDTGDNRQRLRHGGRTHAGLFERLAERVDSTRSERTNRHPSERRVNVPRPDDPIPLTRVLCQRHDVRLPPVFNYFGQCLGAPQWLERHPKLSRSLLFAIPSFGVALIRERPRSVTAVRAPPHDVLARSLVPSDAHAARSIARSLSDDPDGPLASGSERPGRGVRWRPASIQAAKSSGQTTHRLRTFDPTSSPA